MTGEETRKESHLEYLLSAYLLGSISEAGRREVEGHLSVCAACRAELEALRSTVDLLGDALRSEGAPAAHRVPMRLEPARLQAILGARPSRAAAVRRAATWALGHRRRLAWAALLLIGGTGIAGLFLAFASLGGKSPPFAPSAWEDSLVASAPEYAAVGSESSVRYYARAGRGDDVARARLEIATHAATAAGAAAPAPTPAPIAVPASPPPTAEPTAQTPATAESAPPPAASEPAPPAGPRALASGGVQVARSLEAPFEAPEERHYVSREDLPAAKASGGLALSGALDAGGGKADVKMKALGANAADDRRGETAAEGEAFGTAVAGPTGGQDHGYGAAAPPQGGPGGGMGGRGGVAGAGNGREAGRLATLGANRDESGAVATATGLRAQGAQGGALGTSADEAVRDKALADGGARPAGGAEVAARRWGTTAPVDGEATILGERVAAQEEFLDLGDEGSGGATAAGQDFWARSRASSARGTRLAKSLEAGASLGAETDGEPRAPGLEVARELSDFSNTQLAVEALGPGKREAAKKDQSFVAGSRAGEPAPADEPETEVTFYIVNGESDGTKKANEQVADLDAIQGFSMAVQHVGSLAEPAEVGQLLERSSETKPRDPAGSGAAWFDANGNAVPEGTERFVRGDSYFSGEGKEAEGRAGFLGYAPPRGARFDLPALAAREELQRAWGYYRALDPSLTPETFSARKLSVPAPEIGDEGLDAVEYRRRYGVNPFVDTRRDHLSTFAMDVDTASWTIARNALRSGKLPDPAAVRTEEFVNAIRDAAAGDLAEDPDSAFSFFGEGGPSPFGRGLELLKLTVKARELRPGERKNAVLTLVVDTSGSMAASVSAAGTAGAPSPDASRLELVRDSLRTLVDALGPDDRVGIVAYSTHSYLVLPHAPARDRGRILGAISSLEPSGATNVESGLDLAYRVADEVFDPKALNRIVLCSDGVANLGARGPEEILRKVEVFSRRGVYLSSVGFGMGKYDDRMLETLANRGNGNYAYVDTVAEAERIFRENLPSTLQVLAQDAKIQVDFNPEVVSHYRLLGYDNRDIRDEDFRNDKVDAGEVGPGTTVTVLYELRRHANPRGDLGKIYLRYKDVGTGRVEEASYPLSPGLLATRIEDTTDRFRLAACVAEMAELLRKSRWARDGSFGAVLALLRTLSPELAARPEAQEVAELALRAMGLTLRSPAP